MTLTREEIEPQLARVRSGIAELLGRTDEPATNRLKDLHAQEMALEAALKDTPAAIEPTEDEMIEKAAQERAMQIKIEQRAQEIVEESKDAAQPTREAEGVAP